MHKALLIVGLLILLVACMQPEPTSTPTPAVDLQATIEALRAEPTPTIVVIATSTPTPTPTPVPTPTPTPIPNSQPDIVNPGNRTYEQGESIDPIGVTVTDPDDTPTVTVSGLPSGLSYRSGQIGGRIASLATATAYKVYSVTIVATDGSNPPVSATFTITVIGLPPTATPTSTAVPTPTPIPTPTPVPMLEQVRSSVVLVEAASGKGSGFIFDVDGDTAFVVTNQHVIGGEFDVSVLVEDSRTYRGFLLGSDSVKDVAVLSICCSSEFSALSWGEEATMPGQKVVAVGYPAAVSGAATGTEGEVLPADSVSELYGYIPHNAPLSFGSSGGPLLTESGDVLGINKGASATGNSPVYYAVPYGVVGDDVEEWKSRLITGPSTEGTPVSDCADSSTRCGTGTATVRVYLQAGLWVVEASVVDNRGDFEVRVDSLSKDRGGTLLDQRRVSEWSGSVPVRVGGNSSGDPAPGLQVVTVNTVGYWKLRFYRASELTPVEPVAPGGAIELSGSGTDVVAVDLEAGLWTVESSVSGNSGYWRRFYVKVESVDLDVYEYAVVESGVSEWSGRDTVRVGGGSDRYPNLAVGRQLVSVEAGGDWTVRFVREG